MSTQTLQRQEWAPFLDRLSRMLTGQRTEIEVAALDIGDQIEAEWVPLVGITYDHKSDAIDVFLDGGVEHHIEKPRRVSVLEEEGRLASLEIVGDDGTQQIVKLKDPMMMPPSKH